MKIKLFFNICIFFALVKVSVLKGEDFPNENDFIPMGVENYKADKIGITFKVLFLNL